MSVLAHGAAMQDADDGTEAVPQAQCRASEQSGGENMEWNVDTILRILNQKGCEVEEDNEGQLVLYTGLRELDKQHLQDMDTGVIYGAWELAD